MLLGLHCFFFLFLKVGKLSLPVLRFTDFFLSHIWCWVPLVNFSFQLLYFSTPEFIFSFQNNYLFIDIFMQSVVSVFIPVLSKHLFLWYILSSSVWVYIFLKQTSGHLPLLYNNFWYLENKFQTFKIIQDYSVYGWKVTFTTTSSLENNLYYAIILNLFYLHISPWPCFCVSLKLLVCLCLSCSLSLPSSPFFLLPLFLLVKL